MKKDLITISERTQLKENRLKWIGNFNIRNVRVNIDSTYQNKDLIVVLLFHTVRTPTSVCAKDS